MNSENQVAVLEQIFPAQDEQRGQEPQLPTSYSGSHPDLDIDNALHRAASASFEKGQTTVALTQAAHSRSVSGGGQGSGYQLQGGSGTADDSDPLPSWYSEPLSAADKQYSKASTAPASTLEAIQVAANTFGSSLAWWGSYITEFVADVVSENDPTDEEIAEAEMQKQAAKRASMDNQGSVTGEFAQPLTRRHSRSSSGRLTRGGSLRLDGDWQISPVKSPLSPSVHETGTISAAQSDDGEDEDAKKDS